MEAIQPNRRDFLKVSRAAAAMLLVGDSRAYSAEARLGGFSPINSGQAVRLAALEWVENHSGGGSYDGVRLRWSIPILDQAGNVGRCLPERVEVRRGNTTKDDQEYFYPPDINKGGLPTIRVPKRFWGGTLRQTSRFPASFIFVSQNSVITTSAFYFHYIGSDATMLVEDTYGNCISSTSIKLGDHVYVEGTDLAGIRILGANIDLSMLADSRCVYFPADIHFDLQLIATLEVRAAYQSNVNFADVRQRLLGGSAPSDIVTTMPTPQDQFDAKSWSELTAYAGEIAGSQCSGAPQTKTDPSGASFRPLDMFALGVGIRWEYTVFAGFGFRDGPRPSTSALDHVTQNAILTRPPTTDQVYQVTAIFSDGSRLVSNPIFISAHVAAVLTTPQNCRYLSDGGLLNRGTLTVASSATPAVSGFGSGAADIIVGNTNIEWTSPDPRAAGILLSETWQGAGGNSQKWLFLTSPYSWPPRGQQPRSVTIDVLGKLSGRARTFDCWDRLSDEVDVGTCIFAPAGLQSPPPLGAARYLGPNAASCAIDRLVDPSGNITGSLRWLPTATPKIMDWTPDILTQAFMSAGIAFSLRFYRAVRPATAENVVLQELDILSRPGTTLAKLKGPLTAGIDFTGGTLRQGGNAKRILAVESGGLRVVDGDRDSYDLNSNGPCCDPGTAQTVGGTNVLLRSGAAWATPDSKNLSLWARVDDASGGRVALTNTAVPATFNLQLPDAPTEPDTVSFAWRLEAQLPDGTGLIGALSESVTAYRIPVAPRAPYPFQCVVLGFDYYRRLCLKIVLNESDQTGTDLLYDVHWAEAGESNFESHALPGLLSGQRQNNRELYQVFDIPPPVLVDANYLVGVRARRVSNISGPYVVVPLTVTAQ